MSARGEIENTLYRYAWTYDMEDAQGIGACFTADAECVFGGTGLKVGRDAVVAELERRRRKYEPGAVPWHVISNVFIRSETPEEAIVASFYTFVLTPPGAGPKLTSTGWYDDLFVPDDGAWRVHRRRVLRAGEQ